MTEKEKVIEDIARNFGLQLQTLCNEFKAVGLTRECVENLFRIALDAYYGKAVKRHKITLRELASELYNILPFDYLSAWELCGKLSISGLVRKPYHYGSGWNLESNVVFLFDIADPSRVDLSEYTDESGEIDYSKCVVEVEK